MLLLEVDARKRISLGSIAKHDRYLAHVEDDGTIVLTPAVVTPLTQSKFDASPEVGRAVDEFLANPDTGIQRDLPKGDV